jgi:hypothetical protein
MTLHLQPETQAKLAAIAAAHGLSADDYLEALVERELTIESQESLPQESASGMVVEESGLRVYRTGKPISVSLVDTANRRFREERSLRILGDLH